MGYISTEASNASTINELNSIGSNDKIIIDKNGITKNISFKDFKAITTGITLKVSVPLSTEVTCTNGTITYKEVGTNIIFEMF